MRPSGSQEAAETNAREAQQATDAADARTPSRPNKQQKVAESQGTRRHARQLLDARRTGNLWLHEWTPPRHNAPRGPSPPEAAHAQRLKETDGTLLNDSPDAWYRSLRDLGHEAISDVIQAGITSGATFSRWSRDGTRVLTISVDGTVRLWPADGLGEPRVLKGHTKPAAPPPSARTARASLPPQTMSTARLWPANGLGEPMVLRGADEATSATPLHPERRRASSRTSDNRTTRLWRTGNHGENLDPHGHGPIRPLLLHLQPGRHAHPHHLQTMALARLWYQRTVSISPSSSRAIQPMSPPPPSARTAHASSPPQRMAPLASGDATVTGEPLVLKGHTKAVTSADLQPGRLPRPHRLKRWHRSHLARRRSRASPSILTGPYRLLCSSATFSPDGSRVLTASAMAPLASGAPTVTGEPLVLKGHTECGALRRPSAPTAPASSPPRRWHRSPLAHRRSRASPSSSRAIPTAVTSATFSPDGSRVLTASEDGTARIWRADGHGEPLVLCGPYRAVSSPPPSAPTARASSPPPDDGTARLWRTRRSRASPSSSRAIPAM